MMGQMQLNMTWHNTLAVAGHFHATVVTGTTLAFMGLTFWVLKLVFRRDWVGGALVTIQPYLYGGAMGVVALMMMYLGVLFGVPRRHPSVMDIPGTSFDFGAAAPLFVIFGVFAVIAVIGGALFLVLAVASLLVGRDLDASPDPDVAADGGEPMTPKGASEVDEVEDTPHHLLSMRGTFAFTLVFFATFVVMWALNWYLLSQLWQVGG